MAVAVYGAGLYGTDVYGALAVEAAAEAVGGTLDDLGLYVEVTKPDGRTYRWDGDGYAEDVVTGLSFSTKRQDGFASMSCTLPRRIDEDHPDIELRDEITVLSESGDVVWEGRVSAAPRSLDDGHSIDVQGTGWMSVARDRKVVEVFVDRDPGQWGEPSLAQRAARGIAGWPQDKAYTASSERGGLAFTGLTETLIPANSVTSRVYRMPEGNTISKVMFKGTQVNTTNVEAATLYTDSDRDMASAASTAMTVNGTLQTSTPAAAEQYAELRAKATINHTPGAAAPFTRTFTQIAVYGGQVTTHPIAGEPDGVYASEVMEHVISTYCPKLTWAGNDSTYPIPHLAFRELTHPYDVFLELNKYHLLDLACWEDKKVYWSPVDLSDPQAYEWVAYLDDPGFRVTLEGDAIDDQANGVIVEYTSLQSGDTRILWPNEHTELQDTDELNPANRHGDQAWIDRKLTSPCFEADALQIGRVLLAEHNTPKSPGNYTVSGYLRDRAGNWQPGWKVRAGERIIVADHPNRRPRLITETSWQADSHTLTLATDSAIQRVDALFDRQATALAASGLT